MANRPDLERNIALLCVFQALLMALFPIAIMPLFWSHELGMNWSTIMSVQAFFSLVAAVCEVPSGYLADRLGYRRTLLTASLIITLGWGIYAATRSLGTLLLAEALHGIGFSLVSGTDTALLFESLKHNGRENEFPRWYARMRFWGQISEGTAALSAGFLYAWWARLPFVLEVVLWATAAIVVLNLVESPERTRVANHWAKVKDVARYVAVSQIELRGVLLTSAVFGILAYIPVWQIGIYAENSGVSRAWLGPIWAVANYTVAVGGSLATKAKERFGLTSLLFTALGAITLSYVGLGLTHAVFGFAFYYLTTLARGAVIIPLHHAEQQLSPSEDRATIVSIRALLFRLCVVCVMPLVGHLVDRFGQRFTFLVASAPLLVIAALCVQWLRGLTGESSLKVALTER